MCKNLLLLTPFLRAKLRAKDMGEKQGAIGNMLRNPFENLGNLLGTHWEHPPKFFIKFCLKFFFYKFLKNKIK